MTTFVLDEQIVSVPDWVGADHSSFRRWLQSDEFPHIGRICFLQGEVWVDMSKEQALSHNQVKNEYSYVLTGLAKKGRLGRYFPDGMLLTNLEAGLTARPDGLFVSRGAFDTGRIRLVEGAEEGFVELEGSPDMTLEVVSSSSVKKDLETLPELYWLAGVEEYWLVDAREDRLNFDIFRRGAKAYQPVKRRAGWLRSEVFGQSFRLTRTVDESGLAEFSLLVKEK